MPFGKKSPLEALALPGVILAYKYSQFRQRRREAASRRVTERELSALHHKIDKLLSKLEESEPEPPTSQEDECVICINARATMQTSPCGHRVVCRRCFVKTIQSAVAQRLLPLRCVICRARVNRLTSSSGTWRIQESASSYSMGAKSWSSVSGYMPPSASSYSMGDARSGQHDFHSHSAQHNHVTQSASMYSMSSGTSSLSSASNLTSYSKTSSASSGVDSSLSSSSSATNRHYLAAPPVSGVNVPNHSHNHSACPSGCSGAVPRKQLSPSSSSSSNTTNTYPGRRHVKGRIVDLQNRLPPIKEFRSPAKVPHPSPVHISNPRFRYSSYTKSEINSHEIVPLLTNDLSPPRRSSPATTLLAKPSSNNSSLGLSAKISPIISKNAVPKTGFVTPPTSSAQSKGFLQKKHTAGGGIARDTSKMDTIKSGSKKLDLNSSTSSSSSNNFPIFSSKLINHNSNINISTRKSCNNSNHTNFTTNHHNLHLEEKADNKKNESVERKKEEKLKQKAEKEARKEEKRLAKEEERMAKLLAKEEKKKGKKEAKEFLLANDGNNKK